MKVIALRGPENSGKSHTINVVYDFLLQRGFVQVSGKFRQLGNPKFEDILDILIKEGLKVGIVGMGDYQRGKGSLRKLLNELDAEGCDIAICACRDIDALVKVVENYENHIFIDRVPSRDAALRQLENLADAVRILKHVQDHGGSEATSERIEHLQETDKSLTTSNYVEEGEEGDTPGSIDSDTQDAGPIISRHRMSPNIIWSLNSLNLVETQTLQKGNDGLIILFFGTNRNDTDIDNINEKYGDVATHLKYGVCGVSIPPGHVQGVLERPRSFWLISLPENENKDIVLQQVAEQTEQQFFANLNNNLREIPEKSALLFIHGYNNTFADAARRAAQIACDIPFNGISGFYSWPSSGVTLDYLGDVERADSTIPLLEEFIKGLITRTDIEKLHIIAHSMGNRLLTVTLNNLSNQPHLREQLSIIHQIILAAPDIDQQVFNNTILPEFRNVGHQRTLYSSDKDKALSLSEVFRGGRPRLGDAGEALYVTEGIYTIDASFVKSEGNQHSYVFETKELLSDLYYLLHTELPPMKRRLQAKMKNNLPYWLFAK